VSALATSAALRRIAGAVGRGAAGRLRAWADTIDRAGPAREDLLASAIAEVEPALAYLRPASDPLAGALPQYPRISREIRARLVLGEAPVDLGCGLSRAEAHRWLVAGAPDIAEWICDEAGAPRARSVPVARWVVAAWRDPARRAALELHRTGVIAGQRVDGRFADRLDEIIARDVPRGPSSSVDDVFRAATARLAKALERSLESRGGEPLAPVPRWWRPIRCARLIRTGPDLVAEGRAMGHCVATYAHAVQHDGCTIVGLCVLGQRSTVEIRYGRAIQHRGRANAEPPALCVRALAVCARRWGVEVAS
jgi:hypothetical protein